MLTIVLNSKYVNTLLKINKILFIFQIFTKKSTNKAFFKIDNKPN